MSLRLPIEQARQVRAAEGWLDLGSREEACRELDEIAPQYREHHAVLAIRWRMHRQKKEWEMCLEISAKIVQIEPGSSEYWRWFAESQSETKSGAAAAKETLLGCLKLFPSDGYLVYDLACYYARLGELEDARRYLSEGVNLVKAVNEKAGDHLMQYAHVDPDLAELWKQPVKE